MVFSSNGDIVDGLAQTKEEGRKRIVIVDAK